MHTSTDATNEEINPLKVFLEFAAIFRAYIIPIFFILGIFGNSLSIIVFYRCQKKDLATVQYLSFLSLSDFANLFLVTMRLWFMGGLPYLSNDKYGMDFFKYSVPVCKTGKFFQDIFAFLSAWILVAFSLERCYVILFPLKAAGVITNSRRWKLLLGLFIFTIAWNIKSIIMADIYIERSGAKTCFYSPDILPPTALLVVGSIQFFINSFFPLCLILILNIVICMALWRSTKTSARTKNKLSEKELKCIWNLVGISFLYVISMSPQVGMWTYYRILKLIYHEQHSVPGVNLSIIFAIATFGTLLTTLNYSLNFLIYSISLDFYPATVKAIFRVGNGQKNQAG
jgi:hypothetical protein